jgi:probable F420-dependent oxidoreductase
MKIRIGYGLGAQRGLTADRFNQMVDALEALKFDSLWLSERVSGDAPDPIIGLSVAAGRTKKLKLGTSVQVLPGRNPALLAKELASLDVLSGGRLLPGFGLGVVNPAEQQAFGVAREDRSAWFDEALPLVRRLWLEDAVDHDGARFHYEGLRVLPKPVQRPPDVWLGGKAPGELRRVGRLGDGWLASFATPEVCAASRPAIEEAAGAAGREIDPEHFGAMVFYSHGEVPEAVKALIASRNPDANPDELVPSTLDALEHQIEQYIARDFSKLVLVPLQEPGDWRAELEPLADRILALQN